MHAHAFEKVHMAGFSAQWREQLGHEWEGKQDTQVEKSFLSLSLPS